jgi:glycine cleavage system H protein
MSKTKYTEEHEWLQIGDDGLITIGITDFAQNQLGDLVYVQLPEVGKEYRKGEEAAVVESVKTAGEIMMPIDGVVVESNTLLTDEPGKVNEDALGAGWIFKIKVNDPGQLDSLMDEAGYKAYVDSLG